MKIGIFYGSTYGNTAVAAHMLKEMLEKNPSLTVEEFDVSFLKVEDMLEFDKVFIGCSTWYVGEVQDDWHPRYAKLSKLAWNGKQVALFGQGDQRTYSSTFQDALGILGEHLELGGAQLVGFTSVQGYNFDASKAQRGQQFIGLALDDDNEVKLTKPRLEAWVQQLMLEMGLRTLAMA